MGSDFFEQPQGLVVAVRGQLFFGRVGQLFSQLFGQRLGVGMIGLQGQQPLDESGQIEQALFAHRLAQLAVGRGDLFPPRGNQRPKLVDVAAAQGRRHLLQDAGGGGVVEGVEALPGPLEGFVGDDPPPIALGGELADELVRPLGPLGQAGMIVLGQGGQQVNRLVEAAGGAHFGGGAEIVAHPLELFGGGGGQVGAAERRRSFRPPRTPRRIGSTVPTGRTALRAEFPLRQVDGLATGAIQPRLANFLDLFGHRHLLPVPHSSRPARGNRVIRSVTHAFNFHR